MSRIKHLFICAMGHASPVAIRCSLAASRKQWEAQHLFLPVILMCLALAVRLVLAPIEAGLQYITFFPAVTLAAFVGGYRAGMVATMLGVVLATCIFTSPYYSLSLVVISASLWSNLVFAVDGLIVSFLIETMHLYRAKYQAELEQANAAKERLQQLNAELIASVAKRQQAMTALQASEARLSSIFESTPDAIIISDANGMITMANLQVEPLLGYSINELIGQSIEVLVPGKARSNHPALREKFVASPTSRRMGAGLAVKALHKNGSECDVEISLSRIQTDSGLFFAATLRDIKQRKIDENKINRLAFFDQLTGLPNRTLLTDRLTQAMTASTRSDHYGALLFIDLDHFKALNDTLGHDMGDLLLKQVAQRLTECVRAGDTVARIGGDEFVAVLTNLSADEHDAADHVESVGGKILHALGQTFQLDKVAFCCSASVGVTLFLGQAAGLDVLLKQADMAMYRAKNAGRNAMRFFDPEMETVVLGRVALEKDLREAVLAKQFTLYYQPLVAGLGRLIGAEALVRWAHPTRGLVSPEDFITLAEETGLIHPLGQWVLETACHQLVKWASHPATAHLTMAVNVSAQQLKQVAFVDQVLSILAHTGAHPQRLKVELTESQLVTDPEDAISKMNALKAHGVGFSLDDFGTGYSSLSYLKRLPLDQLKIDRIFVNNILTDANDNAIAKMIIALSEALGLMVIAEGVETQAQREQLALNGCHTYQGYLFNRPLPADEFEKYALKDWT